MEYICLCGKNFGNAKKAFREHRKTCQNKPTEFKCQYCGRVFSKKGVCVFHENNCNENPNKLNTANHNGTLGKQLPSKEGGWKCQVCDEVFRTRRLLEEHKKQHKEDNKSHRTMIRVTCYCQFCNKEFTRLSSKRYHEKYCKQNPNAIHRVGHKQSDETKNKISKRRKEYIEQHPDKIPFIMYQHQKQKSYAEQYFMDWLKKEGIYDKDEYRVSRYQLDFAWPEKKIYFEVDGNYHKYDFAKKHDQERDETLSSLGWKCIARVDWSKYQSMLYTEKEQFLLNLKDSISNASFIAHFRTRKEEQLEFRKKLIDDSRVNKLGRPTVQMLSSNEWETRKNLILNSGVDLSKFGWVGKVEKETGLSKKKIENTVKHFQSIFEKIIFKRN